MKLITIPLTLTLLMITADITGSLHAENCGFDGEALNAGANLIYLRARYYDTETGSFTTKDPIGINGSVNTYLFAKGNPVDYKDPTGLFISPNSPDYYTSGNAADPDNLRIQAELGGSLLAGVAVGMGGAIAITIAAPAAVSALITYAGFTPVAAGATIDMGFLLAGSAGIASTAANTTAAVQQGNWSSVAFNVGTLFGGGFVGTSAFGGATSGGRYMANSIGALTGAGDSPAKAMTIFNVWGYEYSKRLVPFQENSDLGLWAASAPTPFSGGSAATFIASGTATLPQIPDTISFLSQNYANSGGASSGFSAGASDGLDQAATLALPAYTPPSLSVGGVLLNTAATLVGKNLSEISGAMYDPVSGQFLFLGTNSPTPVKNINLDYLTTALQAVYGSAVPPFVTLVPSAEITSSATQTENLSLTIYQNGQYPNGGTTYTLSGTFTSAFLDPYPNEYYGSGDSVVIFPGDWAVASLNYAPIWPGIDTTVDVVLNGTDYGTELNQQTAFRWRARFNCVNTNLLFSQWIADANDTLPPAGITLTYFPYAQSNGGGYNNLVLQNGDFFTSDYIIISGAVAIPAVQQRQFGGRVENTEVGWIMEEADRTMKCLCLGSNNLTGAAYNSSTIKVPGYRNLFEIYGKSVPTAFFTRQWFTPQLMTLEQYVDPNTGLASIVFTNATVLCQTEAELTGGSSPPQEQAFCNNMTANYDGFAALKFPCYDPTDPTSTRIIQTNIFGMLKDVMKAVSLARFFRDNNVPVDMWWLNSWQPPIAYTPKSVPTICSYSANNIYYIAGGVQIQLPNTYIASVTASNVAMVVQSSRPAVTGNASGDIQQQVWTNTTPVGTLTAVAANTAAEPQDGNVNLAESDLSFASPGATPLQFTRYYQSSWPGGDAMGPGWVYTPYVLQFSRPSWYDDYGWMTDNDGKVLPVFPGTVDTGLRSDALRVVNMSSGATLDFVSTLVLGYAVNSKNQPYITVNGLNDEGVPDFTPGMRQNGSVLIQSSEQRQYQLFAPDGSVLTFDSNGKLLYAQDRNGWEQDYNYDSAGHLLSVTDDVRQSLVFAYDAQTNYLMSVVGPNGEQVNYAYTNGCLATATHVRSGAFVSYQYNTNNQLVAKTIFNGLNVIQAQPDLKGRANTNLDLRGNSVIKTFTQGSSGTVRTNESWDPQNTDPQFVTSRLQRDRSGRLLASRTVTGAETTLGYNTNSLWANTVALPIAGRPPITIQRDVYGRPTLVSDPGNTNAQNVTATYEPDTTLLQQVTDEKGQATQLSYDASQNLSGVQTTLGAQSVNVNFGYSLSGALSSVTNPLGICVVTMSHDNLDRVTNVVDATGVSINYQYDSLGRLWKLVDPQLASPVVYVYDNFDRVVAIQMPAGTNFYSYDPKMGWLISQTDLLGRTTRYDRDPRTGDVLQSVQIVPGGANLTTVMSYDRLGDLASITPPQSSTITYNYDASGRQIGSVYSGLNNPGAPTGLVCNYATNGLATTITNLIFSWQPPLSSAGLNGYSYGFDQMPANFINTAGTSAAVNSVTIGTHLFQVKAQDTNGAWGPTADFQLVVTNVAGATPPAAPPGLICDHATNGVPTGYTTSFTFSWSVPASQNGIAGYSYALDQTPAGSVTTVGTTANFTSLALGTHLFHVQALGANGVWGPTSDFVLLIAPALALVTPDEPPGLICNLATNGGFTYYTNFVFSWSVPNGQDGIAGYSYALDQAPTNTVLTTATNVTINNVSAGTHLFQVQAVDGNGNSGPPAGFLLVVIAPPGAPTGLVCNHAVNGMATTITNLIFSWQAPVTSAGLNGYSYGFDQLPSNVRNTVGTNAVINNVTLGSHLFQVQAQDTNGAWGPAANLQFTVWAPGTEPPGAPPGLVCNVAANGIPTTTTTNIVFTWQTPASENGVAGYSYALNGTPALSVNTTATAVTYSSLAVGTYNFQVMAKGKNGVWGAASSFQLIVQPPPIGNIGPLPPWSIVVLTLGVFVVGGWFSRRQSANGRQKT